MNLKALINKLKLGFKNNFPLTTSSELLWWMILIFASTAIGLFISLFSYREGIDMGDGSTFYQFAHNIASGEVIYKDFIHFRTPGSYFLQALFINLFGDSLSSVTFALQFEVRVLYALIFGVAIAIFMQFKKPWLGAIVMLLIIFLPGYLQVRVALALLAVVFYIHARRSSGNKRLWLWLSGLSAGLTFVFGQEAAVMAIATIAIAEILQYQKKKIKDSLQRIGILVAGFTVGVLPLLAYVLIYSDIRNFFYYTIYYAFVLQPKGMDVAYPDISYENIIYYIVFGLLLISFYILYCSKRFSSAQAVLLGFIITRLVTLLGRSDIGHLVFVLPEIIFISVFAMLHILKAEFTAKSTMRFLPYGIGLALALYLSVHDSSVFVILGLIIILFAFKFRTSDDHKNAKDAIITKFVVQAVLISMLAVMLYILYPYYKSTIDGMSKRITTETSVSGVNASQDAYEEITKVKAVVEDIDPKVIFSYPIQPFYYTLADHHATRFMTYEPQTTLEEQDATIADLKRNQPGVVVFDPAQAANLSKSLWKINNYISRMYQIKSVITGQRILWVMTPKVSQREDQLSFSVYRQNSQVDRRVADVQSPDKGIFNGVLVWPKSTAEFPVEHQKVGDHVSLSVYHSDSESLDKCGTIRMLNYNRALHSQRVCVGDGIVQIPLPSSVTKITLQSEGNQPVLWNDPEIRD